MDEENHMVLPYADDEPLYDERDHDDDWRTDMLIDEDIERRHEEMQREHEWHQNIDDAMADLFGESSFPPALARRQAE